MGNEDRLEELQERIGHEFEDPHLLRDALTHRSFVNERPELAPRDNERMEFLGDAILDLAASALLFRHYPEATEGELSRRRADLVCERGLAAIAQDLELGASLRLGRGEEKSGGRDKPRLLASALEAVVAAIYLDAGEQEAITIARGLLAPHVDALHPGERDYKSRLQESLQAAQQGPPTYVLTATEGPDHERVFEVEARADDETIGRGSGRSKARAEQLAAKDALARRGED
ncbi:MAG TPA: ribonuclease III [Sandaracinaceae bacterium LLY-WYZ-13_1]|nr:ribonuclease III [Sandaracinaceae bacterium LLY-WYZ-13_1]